MDEKRVVLIASQAEGRPTEFSFVKLPGIRAAMGDEFRNAEFVFVEFWRGASSIRRASSSECAGSGVALGS